MTESKEVIRISGLQAQWDQRVAEVSWKTRGGGQRERYML